MRPILPDTTKTVVDTGRRPAKIAVLAIVALSVVAACSRPGAPVENDPRELTEQLLAIQRGGEEKRLHGLVPGDWTTAHAFDMESLTDRLVDESVGFDVAIPADNYFVSIGAVLVFVNDEKVVYAAAIYGAVFGVTHATGDMNSIVGLSDAGYLALNDPGQLAGA